MEKKSKPGCNVCGKPKRPGSGQRFCSDECAAVARQQWVDNDKEYVNARSEIRRRRKGIKPKASAWNHDGSRNCPGGCGKSYAKEELSSNGVYCRPCSTRKDREWVLRTKYGLTWEDQEAMLNAQDGKCAICLKRSDRLDVDHCHTSGEVRGLLCIRCNRSLLGAANEDADLLERAANYVRSSRYRVREVAEHPQDVS